MDQVSLSKDGIAINGKQMVLFCSSLFYFRIPRAEWEDRILKLKACGYNCVDIYFPWNFHETNPGCWDFSGEKDAGAFLDLLRKYGMYAIARPGPYICSEWDGGGIPAWVLTDPEMNIRENSPAYLAAVRQWYQHIFSIIAPHQVGSAGTVILVQLENELDFFDCQNPRAYMEALRDMARSLGITVPVFGCAGQANCEGATGWADGVDISYNFYGDECDPTFGEKLHYYAGRMRELGRPFLISETSCDHLLLRRELAAGAKLIGPYNQVGGTNFGFTGGLNNWGPQERPASFITTYYSGENMIGSAGELRPQYFEGRRFAGMIHSFGEALAFAWSVEEKQMNVSCSFPTNTKFYRLELKGGGTLLCIPNLGQKSGTAEISTERLCKTVTVPAHAAPFFPVHVPLSQFGGDGTLLFADGELENSVKADDGLTLTFWTESPSPFAEFEIGGKSFRLTKENNSKNGLRAVFAGERELRSMPLAGVEVPAQAEASKLVTVASMERVDFAENLPPFLSYQKMSVQPLEFAGVYRGMGSYRFDVSGIGVLLFGGCDIISVNRDGSFQGSFADAGGTRYIGGAGRYQVNAYIWGHSNFADSRMPALMLDSAKGLSKILEVHSIQEMESNWFFSYDEGDDKEPLHVAQRAVETVVSVNSWNSTRAPLCAVYRKTVHPDENCDGFALEIRNPSARISVSVDGKHVAQINSLDPFVNLSDFLTGKTTAELEFRVSKRDWSERVGVPVLYSGKNIQRCEIAAMPEKLLTETVHEIAFSGENMLPIRISGHSLTAFHFYPNVEPSRSVYLKILGKNILAFVWSGDKLLGRLLQWDGSPTMCGNQDLIYLPASYRAKDDGLRLVITALGCDAELSSISFEAVEP